MKQKHPRPTKELSEQGRKGAQKSPWRHGMPGMQSKFNPPKPEPKA